MKKIDVRTIAINAVIAAIYAALTIGLAPISYGQVQMRVSEMMIFLAFYNKKYIPGLVLGCFIANIPSSLGAYDMVFGTFATLLAVIAMNKVSNRYVGGLLGGLINGLIVGLELTIAFRTQIPFSTQFMLNAVYVFIGEAVVLEIGAFLFGLVEKNQPVMKFIKA